MSDHGTDWSKPTREEREEERALGIADRIKRWRNEARGHETEYVMTVLSDAQDAVYALEARVAVLERALESVRSGAIDIRDHNYIKATPEFIAEGLVRVCDRAASGETAGE